MRTSKKHAKATESVIDAETGEEVQLEETEVAAASMADKLKQLRAELKTSQRERDENLAGWQRAKADLVNYRRTVEQDRERDGARARGTLVRALVAPLDSFDSAMASETWHQVDANWREGMERVAAQLHQALESEGLERFGDVGDEFDPTHHECMSVVPTTKKKEDHTLAQVLQKGYRVGAEVIRPAKVVIHQHS